MLKINNKTHLKVDGCFYDDQFILNILDSDFKIEGAHYQGQILAKPLFLKNVTNLKSFFDSLFHIKRTGKCGTYRIQLFRYSGQLNNNKKEGNGRLTHDNEPDYEGKFVNDIKTEKENLLIQKRV